MGYDTHPQGVAGETNHLSTHNNTIAALHNDLKAALDAAADGDLLGADANSEVKTIDSGTYGKALARAGMFIAPSANFDFKTANNEWLVAAPLRVDGAQTIASLNIYVETAGETDSVIRLGVYDDDGSGQPGALLLDAGTVASDTTGTKAITTSLSVAEKWVWLAAVQQGASTTAAEVVAYNSVPVGMGGDTGAAVTRLLRLEYPVWARANVSGALPDPFAVERTISQGIAVAAEV